MLKTFIIPYISFIIFPLVGFCMGIFFIHHIFLATFSLPLLYYITSILFILSLIAALYYRPLIYFLLAVTCGAGKTSKVLYDYNKYYYQTNLPLTIQEITKTGNPLWPFCTVLSQEQNNNSYKFLLYTKKKPSCLIGDICTTSLTFSKPKYNEFCRFLLKEKCLGTAFSYNFKPLFVSSSFYNLQHFLSATRNRLISSIATRCSYKTRALFTSLCLGNKKIFKRDLKKIKLYFRSWGIVHHLARSGLHLVIVLFLWYLLLSLIPLSYPIKTFFISCIAFIFALFSFEGISFSRSLVIFLFTQLLLWNKQQTNTLHLLLLAALVFLFYNPFLIFGLDFQLSFFITFLLCLFSLLNRQKKARCCKLLLTDYKKA